MEFVVGLRSGTATQTITTFQHTYTSSQYDEAQTLPRVEAKSGDLLTLHIALAVPDPNAEYIPYGEQPSSPTMRWVSLDLP